MSRRAVGSRLAAARRRRAPLVEIAIARGERSALGEGLGASRQRRHADAHRARGRPPGRAVHARRTCPATSRVSPPPGERGSSMGAQPLAVRATRAQRARVPLRPVSVRIRRAAVAPRPRDDAASARADRAGGGVGASCRIIGVNAQWLQLARQRDAINAQMTELLLNAFPKTTVVLDAPDQMSRQLERLRVAAGELSPDGFPVARRRPRALARRRCR